MYKSIFLTIVLLCACTNLKEKMQEDNAGFIADAYRYEIKSPLSYENPLFSKYMIKDQQSKAQYEIELDFADKESKYYEMEAEYGYDDEERTKEVATHQFSFSNPLNKDNYIVKGNTTAIRTKEGSSDVVIGPSENEFSMWSGEKEIGRINTLRPNPLSLYEVKYPAQIDFHGKTIFIEYTRSMNKVTMSISDEDGTMALIGLEGDGFVADKFAGDLYIRGGLSDEKKADVLTLFIVSDTVISISANVKIN